MRAVDIARKLCPKASRVYIEALENGDDLLADAGITTPLRLAHALAQWFHETGGLTILVENPNYTRANLAKMWDSGNWRRYFPNKEAMMAMAGKGAALFDIVYANRMGNGPPESRDGSRFRGRSFQQNTGRDDYEGLAEKWQAPFDENPDLLIRSEHALKGAVMEWKAKRCNTLADRNAIKDLTRKINGGLIGFDDRVRWFDRIWSLMQKQGEVEKIPSWEAADPDPDVEWLQDRLIELGYSVERDGRKGPETVKAIKDFQRSAGIPVDGVAGPITREAMKVRLEAPPKLPKPESASPPAVENPIGKGVGPAMGGGMGEVVLQQAEKLEPIAPYSPYLRAAVAVLILIGVGLMLYGVYRQLRPKRGAPS